MKALLFNTQYFDIDSNTYSAVHREGVVAFPLQQWLSERTTVLGLRTLPVLSV
jgi:hypothetical protein